MPSALSSWAAILAAQELMYRYEQHPSGSGFLVLIFFRWCFNTMINQIYILVRHPSIHQRIKMLVVIPFKQMIQFMDNYILHAWQRRFRQLKTKPDPPVRNIAGSPAGLHIPDPPFIFLHAHSLLPQFKIRLCFFLYLFAIKLSDQGFPLLR